MAEKRVSIDYGVLNTGNSKIGEILYYDPTASAEKPFSTNPFVQDLSSYERIFLTFNSIWGNTFIVDISRTNFGTAVQGRGVNGTAGTSVVWLSCTATDSGVTYTSSYNGNCYWYLTSVIGFTE